MENAYRSNLYKRKINKLLMSMGLIKKPPDNWIKLSYTRDNRRKDV